MSNISTFIGHLRNGLARPGKYIVDINAPVEIGTDETVQIFCHTCQLPMRSLLGFEHKTGNNTPYKAPYTYSYEPVTLTFYADKNMNTRRYFERWQSLVTFPHNNINNYMNDFVGTVVITMIDLEGNEKYKVKLLDAFPLNVGAVDLSYSQMNAVVNVSVTLSYRMWVSE